MKINIGRYEFTECWDGVLYKVLSDYPKVSDNEMKDVYRIIVPSEYKEQLLTIIPENLLDRTFCLSHENLDVWQWSEKVYSFVKETKQCIRL